MTVWFPERAAARTARLSPLLALGAALLAAIVGALAAVDPLLIVVLAALGFVGTVVVAAFVEPRWVVIVQMAFVLTYAPIVLSTSYGLPVSPQTLSLLLLIALGIRRALDVERLSLAGNGRYLLAFLTAVVVSLAFAADRARAGVRLVELLELLALTVLVVLLVDRPEWLRRAAWAVAGSGVFLGGLALFQQLTRSYGNEFLGFAKVVEGDRGLLRSAGPIDANYLGQFLVAAAALAFFLGLGADRRWVSVGAYGAAAAMVGGIFFTHSRGALLALGVALLVAAVLRRVSPLVPAVGLAALAVAGALVLPSDAKQRLVEVVRPGSAGIAYASDASVANRFAENAAAAAMFVDHPLLGVGPANYAAVYHDYAMRIGLDARAEERPGVEQAAHNLYLEALAEYGFVGAAAFLLLVGRAFWGGLRLRRSRVPRDALLGDGIVAALAGFFTASLFLHSAYPHYLWLMIALGLAALRVTQREPAA